MTDDSPRLDVGDRLDLEAVDVADRQRRTARDRPDPPAELRQWEASAERRMFQRPLPPNIILEPVGFDQEDITAPHSDMGLWVLQLADAFGTRSQAVINLFLRHLQELCGKNIWDEAAQQRRMDETELSAILALINAFRPRNEPEAMLAAQMVATHLLTMRVGARALRYDYDTRTAASFAKLAKAFAAQTEAMQGLKGRKRTARQSIKVSRESHHHQHIHVHRGAGENEGQPHERTDATTAETDDCRSLVRSQDAGGVVVPLPRDEGQGALPATRRQVPRRAKG